MHSEKIYWEHQFWPVLLSQSCAEMRKINRPWLKSEHFWRASGYISTPTFRPFLSCFPTKCPETSNLISFARWKLGQNEEILHSVTKILLIMKMVRVQLDQFLEVQVVLNKGKSTDDGQKSVLKMVNMAIAWTFLPFVKTNARKSLGMDGRKASHVMDHLGNVCTDGGMKGQTDKPKI